MIRTSQTGSFLLVALSLAAAGCKGERQSNGTKPVLSASTASASTASASAASASAGPESAEPKPEPIDEPAVKAAVDAWVRAQNQGDFASYERAYAERFTGIKRNGSRVFQADRKGWLADRKAMFARPLTVAAEDIQISGSPTFVRVRFTQDFRTPTFHDRGPKELQLTKARDAWQIVREEMLDSEAGGGVSQQSTLTAEDFSFVRELSSGTLILLDRYASLNPVNGPVQHVENGVVYRSVRADLVEEKYRKLLGKTFRVYDGSGNTCEVTPTKLALYGEVYPHFGTINTWEGTEGSSHVYSNAERALAAWQMVGDDRWIALHADQVCAGFWARAADRKAPEPFALRAERQPIEDAAVKALEATEGYRSMKVDAEDALGKAPERHVGTQVFESRGGVQFVTAYVRLGEGFCSEYGGSHFGVFRRNGDAVELLSDPKDGYSAGDLGDSYDVVRDRPNPLSAVDLDGDGSPELVFENVLFGLSGGKYEVIREAKVRDFDCPC